MRVLEKLKGMDATELAILEQNARRMTEGNDPKTIREAHIVLEAVSEERAARQTAERQKTVESRSAIAETVKDLDLYGRTIIAFKEMPPAPWEVDALKAIAEMPGSDFNTLARHIGKRDGGYMNLAVGSLCSAREHYLGIAPPSERRPGEKTYSALLIDFTPHKNADGSEWHGWTLKPPAALALQHLGVIAAPDATARSSTV